MQFASEAASSPALLENTIVAENFQSEALSSTCQQQQKRVAILDIYVNLCICVFLEIIILSGQHQCMTLVHR